MLRFGVGADRLTAVLDWQRRWAAAQESAVDRTVATCTAIAASQRWMSVRLFAIVGALVALGAGTGAPPPPETAERQRLFLGTTRFGLVGLTNVPIVDV